MHVTPRFDDDDLGRVAAHPGRYRPPPVVNTPTRVVTGRPPEALVTIDQPW
jgi:hypothetical protein